MNCPATRIMVHDWMSTDILGSRAQGRQLRDLLMDHLSRQEPVTLDFGQIAVMTSAFADECFGKLWDQWDHADIRRTIYLTGLRGNNRVIFDYVLRHRAP